MFWQSKLNSQHIKHGFYKRHDKQEPDDVITDCLLSRVLNKRDEMQGKLASKRTPKSKIIAYKTSSSDLSGKKYYYTMSRVIGLEGKPPQNTVMGHDLRSYLNNNYYKKPDLTGTFEALVDSVLVRRWDVKTPNFSAPDVRNFDMTMALSPPDNTYSKSWDKKEFKSLVTGASTKNDKKASNHKVGTVEAIAHAFTQVVADFGTRANEYYMTSAPMYSADRERQKQKDFKVICEAVKKDINDNAREGETPTQTVLRVFNERAEGIRAALYADKKNPGVEILNEMQRATTPMEDRRKVPVIERKLMHSLTQIQGYVEELWDGKVKAATVSCNLLPQRGHHVCDHKDKESSTKRSRDDYSSGAPVDILGRTFYPIEQKNDERAAKAARVDSADRTPVDIFGMTFYPVGEGRHAELFQNNTSEITR